MLYYVRNRLKDEPLIDIPSQGIMDEHAEKSLFDLKDELTGKMDDLKSKMKDMMKKKNN